MGEIGHVHVVMVWKDGERSAATALDVVFPLDPGSGAATSTHASGETVGLVGVHERFPVVWIGGQERRGRGVGGKGGGLAEDGFGR